MVFSYDDSLESVCRHSVRTLQELEALVRESGEPIPWGPCDERVEKFFEGVVYPSPEHGEVTERRGKWTQVMHYKLELLAGCDLGQVCAIRSCGRVRSQLLWPQASDLRRMLQ